MKSIIALTVVFLAFTVSLDAASSHNSYVKTDTTNQISLNALLNYYYNIKNALVDSDAPDAASKAGELANAIQKINIKSLTEEEHKTFTEFRDKLADDAKNISKSKDLSKQRIYFASLSDNFYSLAKEVKLTSQPIYHDYCPMKKKFWLSSESKIRNPYYGKAMLTCGSIEETLK